jgi:DNA-binding IclR family transcriptional regulator
MLIEVGARRPLGIGAGSLALIAFGPEDEFERVLASNAPRYPQYRGLTSEKIRSMAMEEGFES